MGGNRAALYFQEEMMHGYEVGDKVRAACDITAEMLDIALQEENPGVVMVAFGEQGTIVQLEVEQVKVQFDAYDVAWWVEPNWIIEKTTEDDRAQWAILQLMGQRTIAGRCRPSNRWGQNMLMLEVPAAGNNPPYTRFYAHGAIFSITPVEEAVARVVALAVNEPQVERRLTKDGG